MLVFKICQEKYSGSLVASGIANRWNKREQFVIYTAESISLSTLELVAHRSGIVASVPYKLLTIEIAEGVEILKIDCASLPRNWRTMEAYPILQDIGSDWYLSNKSPVLQVPSAIVPQEFNYIMNTKHPDFSMKVKIIEKLDFEWDKRIL